VVEEIRVYKLPCREFFVLLFVWIRLGGLIMLRNQQTPKHDHIQLQLKPAVLFSIYIAAFIH
jgi:hypothetical protein